MTIRPPNGLFLQAGRGCLPGGVSLQILVPYTLVPPGIRGMRVELAGMGPIDILPMGAFDAHHLAARMAAEGTRP